MRFKSVLGAFIFVLLASFIALSIFVQTRTFGKIVTKVITDIAERRAQTQVSLGKIGISVFPPGIELYKVSLAKDLEDGKSFNAELGKLGFYIGLIELEEKKLSLGEIRITDSVIEYKFPDEGTEEIQQIDQSIVDKVFSIDNDLPVRIDNVIIENSRIMANHEIIEAKRFKLFKKKDLYIARFHLANLAPFSKQAPILDEIWGDAEIGKKNINIQRLRIQHDVHTLLLKGAIDNWPKLKKAEFVFAGESTIYLKNLEDLFEFPADIKVNSGFAHANFNLKYKEGAISGSTDLAINDLRSNIVFAEKIIASIGLESGVVKLNDLNFSHKKQKLNLLNSPEVYNVNTGKYLYRPIQVSVEELRLGNVLRYLPALKPLKGKLTGKMDFIYDGNYHFNPVSGFTVTGLGLVVGKENSFNVIKAKKAKLSHSSFRIVENEFQMDSVVELPNSILDVHGFVNSKEVGFTVKDAIVDLEDLGNIAKLDIKGKGKLNIRVNGPIEDVIINIAGKTEGFEVLGYRLGQADKDISIDLKGANVIIHRMEAILRDTPISGTGVINYRNSDIALGINSTKAAFGDLKEILSPIFSKITFLPNDLEMSSRIDANIFGKTSLDKLKVKATVQFNDMISYGENFNSGQFEVRLEDQLLQIQNLKVKKGNGQIKGEFALSLANDRLKLNYEWDGLVLSTFNIAKRLMLNLNGSMSGSLSGEGSTNDYVLDLIGVLQKTQTNEYKFPDSNISMKISPKSLYGKMNLLGEIIKSEFNWSLDKFKTSKVKLDVWAPSIRPLAAAFLGQHIENKKFRGELKFNLDTSFKSGFREMNLAGHLETLIFQYDTFNVNFRSQNPQFIIEEDKVRKWDLNIKVPDLTVISKGEGTFGRHVSLMQEVQFNSRIFEVLAAPVLSSEGAVINQFKIEGNGDRYSFNATSRTKELDMTLDGVPFPLNKLSYWVDFSNNRLSIKELRTSLENGYVLIKGDIFLDSAEPDVNLKYVFDRAEIPVLGKSMININGEGIILGNSFPYNVGGELVVNKANIVNELSEFGQKSSAVSQVRFLPPSQESPIGKLFNLNVNVKLTNPARITNSLMDVSLKGEVRLLGNPSRPRGEGRLFSPPNLSRIFFKNNEYYITNADLNFSPRKEISNPDFDIQSLTYISTYKVYSKAYGDLERFNFDLTSDPPLPRNSILSLIAFGYTDEIQNTLKQDDQQNLTQVGVGSFVFDRFKISDILNKQFGLQVNLGTVFEQSQESLISGRASEGQGGNLGRTRSATKIELKKRLDEALTLSVSSTMGGSIGQRQSMNLNYGINKNVQAEGVYEMRTSEEGTSDANDNSVGADLKFRWTFK